MESAKIIELQTKNKQLEYEKDILEFELFIHRLINLEHLKQRLGSDGTEFTNDIIVEINRRHNETKYDIRDYYYICDKLEILQYMYEHLLLHEKNTTLAEWIKNNFKDMQINDTVRYRITVRGFIL
jgi:hypothetical protein